MKLPPWLPQVALGIILGGVIAAGAGADPDLHPNHIDSATEPMTGIHMWWYMGRAGGFIAYWLLFASLALGLAVSSRFFDGLLARPWVFDMHQFLSLFVLVAMLAHALVLLPDPYAKFQLKELFVPLEARYKPEALAVGIVTFYGSVIISATFYLKKYIGGQKAWRNIHYLTFLLFLGALAHGVFAGTDSREVWAQYMYLGSGLGILFLTFFRILASRRAAARSAREPGAPAKAAPGRAPAAPAPAQAKAAPAAGATPAAVGAEPAPAPQPRPAQPPQLVPVLASQPAPPAPQPLHPQPVSAPPAPQSTPAQPPQPAPVIAALAASQPAQTVPPPIQTQPIQPVQAPPAPQPQPLSAIASQPAPTPPRPVQPEPIPPAPAPRPMPARPPQPVPLVASQIAQAVPQSLQPQPIQPDQPQPSPPNLPPAPAAATQADRTPSAPGSAEPPCPQVVYPYLAPALAAQAAAGRHVPSPSQPAPATTRGPQPSDDAASS